MHARKRNLDCLEKIVGRNMHVKGNSGEGSEGKEEEKKKLLSKINMSSWTECLLKYRP